MGATSLIPTIDEIIYINRRMIEDFGGLFLDDRNLIVMSALPSIGWRKVTARRLRRLAVIEGYFWFGRYRPNQKYPFFPIGSWPAATTKSRWQNVSATNYISEITMH